MSIADESLNDTGRTSDGSPTLPTSRLLPTPTACLAGAGARSRSGKRKGEPLLGAVATLLPEDSLASQYLLPAGVRLNVIRVGSGRTSRESFAYFDRDTCLWKMYQACLFEGLVTFSETWPKWGLMRSGRVYRRAPLVRPISAKGFSLLPTPLASEAGGGGQDPDKRRAGGHTPKLRDLLMPTPTATAHKRGYSGQAEKSLLCHSHAGGPINPEWLEHLQGFPLGWTVTED